MTLTPRLCGVAARPLRHQYDDTLGQALDLRKDTGMFTERSRR